MWQNALLQQRMPTMYHVCTCLCVVGVVTTMFGLGPLCGNLLAAVTLKLPENISAAGTLYGPQR